MKTNVVLDESDVAALGRLLRKDEARARKDRLTHISRRSIFMMAALVVAVLLFGEGDKQGMALRMVGAFVILTGLYIALVHFVGRRRSDGRIAQIEASHTAEVGRSREYSLTDDGIAFRDGAEAGVVAWSRVADIVEDEGRLYVFVHGERPVIIPQRAFASPAEAGQFVRLARDLAERRLERSE